EAVRLPVAGGARWRVAGCARMAGRRPSRTRHRGRRRPHGSLMFFRNLTFFRFPASLDLADLESHLASHVLKPVGPMDMASSGFIPPFGRDAEALSHSIGDATWISVGREDRLLPAAVVNDL